MTGQVSARIVISIYQFSGLQPNVATAAPGMKGFNGGRWQVHLLSFANYAGAVAAHDANGSGDLDSAVEVHAALASGAVVGLGIVRMFECPVIKAPAN